MGFGLGKESGSSCLGFVLEAGCLPVGLAEPLGEVGPVSQAPVDSHCNRVSFDIDRRLTQNWHGLGQSDC